MNQTVPRPNNQNGKQVPRCCDEHQTAQIPVTTQNSLQTQRQITDL